MAVFGEVRLFVLLILTFNIFAHAQLPQSVSVKTDTQSFNLKNEVVIENKKIFLRPRHSSGLWRELETFPTDFGDPVSLSMDDEMLFVVTETGRLITGKNFLNNDGFTWTEKWGHPLWKGKGIRLPGDTIDFAGSYLSNAIDQFLLYPTSVPGVMNRRWIGSGCTSVYVLRGEGNQITLLDPWLPVDYSYEICSPEKGRFKAIAIAASGSIVSVMNKFGDIKTKRVDFDILGSDEIFFSYHWGVSDPDLRYFSRGPLKNIFMKMGFKWSRRDLPVESWKDHRKIPGIISREISLHKYNIPGAIQRELRVKGKILDHNRWRTGYWWQDISRPMSLWQFVVTDEKIDESVFLSSYSLDDSTQKDLSNLKAHQYLSSSSLNDEKKPYQFKVLDFNPHCSPARMIVESDDQQLELELHFSPKFRQNKKSTEWLEELPMKYMGAIKLTLSRVERRSLSLELNQFIEDYLGVEIYTPVDFEVSLNEIKIRKKGFIGQRGQGFQIKIQ